MTGRGYRGRDGTVWRVDGFYPDFTEVLNLTLI
jgi:hypothetical protein